MPRTCRDSRNPSAKKTSRLLATALCAMALSCAGSSANAPSQARNATAAQLPSPPKPWSQMDERERKRWMVERVMPAMEPRFAAWKPERYGNGGFTCMTCHGEDARQRGFEMPNPELPALYPTGHPEQQRMVREHPEAVRFMYQQVTKPMMVLLGMREYDPQTGQGFGCFSCHPSALEASAGSGSQTAEPPPAGSQSVPPEGEGPQGAGT